MLIAGCATVRQDKPIEDLTTFQITNNMEVDLICRHYVDHSHDHLHCNGKQIIQYHWKF